MSIGTLLYTWLKGEPVGSDSFGNRYFQEKSPRRNARRKRWVLYAGEVEASNVPPDWNAWLHHTVDTPPPEGGKPRRPWQKTHQPNLTGSPAAYRPPGHTLEGGQRARGTGDYEPWTPA